MTDTAPYQPDRSLPAKLSRRMTQWRAAAPVAISADRAIVTVTFDDFPKSAATHGADVMDRFEAKAGYYACTGLADQVTQMGDMFSAGDLLTLHEAGHEIGAHTHTHLDCARAAPETAADDADRNLIALSAMGFRAPVTAFAFPFGETRYATKQAFSRRFETCRGILPGINRGRADRAQLRAMELDDTATSVTRASDAIETVARSGGWLILFTHDVQETPSPFGVSKADLLRLMQQGRDAGVTFLPPTEAARQIGISAP